MDVPDFSPLEVETYFVEPVGTDIQVFYTIPAEGWMSWFGAFKPGLPTDPPNSVVGLSILNVTNVVQYQEAERRGVEVLAVPTEEACRLLSGVDPREAAAVIHVTC